MLAQRFHSFASPLLAEARKLKAGKGTSAETTALDAAEIARGARAAKRLLRVAK